MSDFLLYGIPIAAVIIGLGELAKGSFGLPARWAALVVVALGVLFAAILFVTYKEQIRQVIEEVKTNTEALRDNCNANMQLIRRLDALERLIQREHNHA